MWLLRFIALSFVRNNSLLILSIRNELNSWLVENAIQSLIEVQAAVLLKYKLAEPSAKNYLIRNLDLLLKIRNDIPIANMWQQRTQLAAQITLKFSQTVFREENKFVKELKIN